MGVLPTTYWSLIVQPPPLTCAGCAAPLCQTKKTILFVYLLWFFLPVTVCVLSLSLSLSLSLMAGTYWFQLILTSFGWHVIPTGHFPQKSLSKNPKIGFSLFPPPDHTVSYLWIITHHFLYWCLGLACASPSSPVAHAFAVIWRLVYTFYRALLASYGVGCFSIYHSLWLASFGGWALSDHGHSFPRLTLYSLHDLVSISCHTTLLFLL